MELYTISDTLSASATKTTPGEEPPPIVTELESTPSPTMIPISTPSPTSKPEPTTFQATSRQDLIDCGFEKVSENYYVFSSKISGGDYLVEYSDDINDEGSFGQYLYLPPMYVESTSETLKFYYNSANDNMPTIQYYPEPDSRIAADVYEALESDVKDYVYAGLKPGYYFVIDITNETMEVYSYGDIPKEITAYIEKHVDLKAMLQEALQKYEKLNENLKREFGVMAEEILALK